jgi:hypothetical protein
MNAAKQCKEMGWGPGTKLYGKAPHWSEPGTLRITAVGVSAVLARRPHAAEYAWHSLEGFEAVKVKSPVARKEGAK